MSLIISLSDEKDPQNKLPVLIFAIVGAQCRTNNPSDIFFS
jgi:hypothetical protein